MEHVTVWRDEESFAAWPFSHGLWAYADGEVVAGFTVAPCRYEQPADVQHWVLDPISQQVTVRSRDGGRTWSDELEVTATHERLERDWFDGRFAAAPPEPLDWNAPDFCMTTGFAVPPARARHAGYVQYSRDRGRTWEGPYVVPSFSFGHVQVKSHYVVRPDGVVLLFVTVGRAEPDALHYGTYGSRFVAVYGSPDGGVTWRYFSSILPGHPDGRFVERYYASPALLPDGRIVAALRCQLDGANQWPELYESGDGGWTWQLVGRFADWGSPTDLVALRDGRLVAVYGRRTPPFGVRARVSEDGGRTWQPELVLRDDGGSFDLGYPRAVELPGGDVLATYYFNRADDPVRQIAATRFTP
jgi:hypothetical protein